MHLTDSYRVFLIMKSLDRDEVKDLDWRDDFGFIDSLLLQIYILFFS